MKALVDLLRTIAFSRGNARSVLGLGRDIHFPEGAYLILGSFLLELGMSSPHLI